MQVRIYHQRKRVKSCWRLQVMKVEIEKQTVKLIELPFKNFMKMPAKMEIENLSRTLLIGSDTQNNEHT